MAITISAGMSLFVALSVTGDKSIAGSALSPAHLTGTRWTSSTCNRRTWTTTRRVKCCAIQSSIEGKSIEDKALRSTRTPICTSLWSSNKHPLAPPPLGPQEAPPHGPPTSTSPWTPDKHLPADPRQAPPHGPPTNISPWTPDKHLPKPQQPLFSSVRALCPGQCLCNTMPSCYVVNDCNMAEVMVEHHDAHTP